MSRVPVVVVLLALSGLLLLGGCGAKTDLFGTPGDEDVTYDLVEAVDHPPTVRCPDDEVWTSPGKFTVIESRAEDEEGPVDILWALLSAPTGSTTTISPLRATHTTLTPDLIGDYRLKVTVTDSADQSDFCESLVHAVENPPTALCPPDVENTPTGLPVTLEGDGDDVDGEIVGFEWSMQDQPDDSHPTLAPVNEATTHFTPDLEGDYEVRFEVIDDHGYRGYCVVKVSAIGAPALDCPEEPLSGPTRRPITLSIPVLSGDVAAWRWEVVTRPAGSSEGVQPVPADGATPTFTPDKPGRYLIRGTATNARGLSSFCEIVLDATPSPPDAICPGDTTTSPLAEIRLTGSGVDDGTIVAYRWEITSRPEGSSAPDPSPVDAATTSFMADLAGTYGFRFSVTDNDGNTASCVFNVIAIPTEGMRVEMYWNPPDRSCGGEIRPGCDPTDVDLHLLHPSATRWFDGLYDCYYADCNATGGMILDWDTAGQPDNPRLDLDDVDGYGPENINIDEPVIGHEYWVGVHYYADDGFGPSQVYIKVYCSTVSADPVAEFGPVTIRVGGDFMTNDFWRVAAVTWNGFTCTVRSLAAPDGTPNIVPRSTVETTR